MFQTLVKAFKIKEVRRKILITFALLIVYRIGCYIPVPGVGKGLIASGSDGGLADFTYLQIMNAMTGSALQYGTLFAMGIGPYINASIIIQLLTVAIPALERLSKQGEEGRKKIANITRIVTMILAVAQAIGILVGFADNIQFDQLFGYELKWLGYVFLVVIYTAGAALTMWLGERITDYGVSNGISMLIFTGIIATAGQYIIALFNGDAQFVFWQVIIFVAAALLIFAAIVTVDSAERKIPVQYAKQVKGRKMYGGQSTHIPIKVNSSGVMPLIFAFAILSFPDLIINLFHVSSNNWYSTYMGTGSWLNTVVMCALILFFAYFYNAIQFKPEDISRNIQQNGGFIPGIRPGHPTTDYLKRVSNRIVLFGAIYLALVALIPSLVFNAISAGLANVFSATGLLIVVSVALEFNQALESQIMMKNYKGFLK